MNALERKELQKLVHKLSLVFEEVPMLNRGGCAICALATFRYVRSCKNLDIDKFRVIYGYNWEVDFECNSESLSENNILSNSCSHAYMIYRDFIFDAEGVYNGDYSLKHEISNEDAILFSVNNNPSSWNEDCDRWDAIRSLQYHLEVSLKDVDFW